MGDDNAPSASTSSSSSRRKEEKARKKDQRSWDNVMKSMGDMSETERLAVIQEKYTALYNDLRKSNSSYQNLEKKFVTLKKERDQAQSELNKNILAKAKLESLCRELQKQNKTIKDENLTRVKEEEEKRREVATTFTERLNALSSMMDENKDKSVRLREENMNMTIKLTELYNKFQERETHLADVNHQLDSQKDLFDSKLKKMEVEYKTERKAWEEEAKTLLANLLKSTETNRLLEENIRSMQANLDIYKNQYSDFEETMTRSNEVFKTFQGEISKLQRLNNSLEKERNDYASRWQSCHNSIVEISEKNQQLVQKVGVNEKKVSTLEKLCRQLQTERTALHKQLEDLTKTEIPSAQQREDNPQKIKISCSKDVMTSDEDNLDASASVPPLDDDSETDFVDLMDPTRINPELDGQQTSNQIEELSNIELNAAGDASQMESHAPAPLSSTSSIGSVSDGVSSSGMEIKDSSSDIYVKETKSVPITKKDHLDLISEILTEPAQSSSGDLHRDLSLEALPLYKPHAVTDVPSQGGHTTLVKESAARTNILDQPLDMSSYTLDSSTDVSTTPTDSTTASSSLLETTSSILTDPDLSVDHSSTSEEALSGDTIVLKESEGQTDFKKK